MVDVLETKLGRYNIRERLGKGGMATVYKAWDTNLDRWVAVKVLHDHLVEEADFKERFEREAKLIANLSHPHIVQVYDFNVERRGGQALYYMVMQRIAGQSLKALMDDTHQRGARLPLERVETILQEVCSALHYAHAQGMVHRDVTPGNILFDSHDRAVLTDFGIARLVSDARLTQSGMTTGTPMYMSPEQGLGRGGDSRSDIYSLGVILYEMLTGQPPYYADSAIAVVMKHINDPLPTFPAKDERLSLLMQSVIYRALAKDPADRYQNANDLLYDFQRAKSGTALAPDTLPSGTLSLPAASTAALPAAPIPAAITASQLNSKPSTTLMMVLSSGLPWGKIAAGIAILATVLGAAAISRSLGSAGTTANSVPPVKSAAPAMTNGPLLFQDTFSPDRRGLVWQITTDDKNIYRNIESSAYRVRHSLPAMAITALFDQHYEYAGGFQYEAELEISAESQPDTGTGIVFRYQNPDKYYVFAVNGQGQVSIWLRDGDWMELRRGPINWTPAEGVNPAGQKNTLRLIDLGERLIGFVNGKQVVDVAIQPKVDAGATGIYLATTSSPQVAQPLADVRVLRFKVDAAFSGNATETAASPRP